MSELVLNLLFVFCILLTAFIVATVVGHVFVAVPYIPTPRAVLRRAIIFAGIQDGDTVYDLGAGDGRMLILVKKKFPHCTAIGVEFLPTIWLIGKVSIWLSRTKVLFRCADALKQDVRNADVIFLYLIPKLMRQLEDKFDAELKPGTKVISYTFSFYKHKPVKEELVQWFWWKRKMYLYKF